ncbi:MAG: hypothetical protein NTZ16_08405, partial [Verrucomicrobia bacterium]|nr:hypothetical protein [Verrucomicrobiota bacterium]
MADLIHPLALRQAAEFLHPLAEFLAAHREANPQRDRDEEEQAELGRAVRPFQRGQQHQSGDGQPRDGDDGPAAAGGDDGADDHDRHGGQQQMMPAGRGAAGVGGGEQRRAPQRPPERQRHRPKQVEKLRRVAAVGIRAELILRAVVAARGQIPEQFVGAAQALGE